MSQPPIAPGGPYPPERGPVPAQPGDAFASGSAPIPPAPGSPATGYGRPPAEPTVPMAQGMPYAPPQPYGGSPTSGAPYGPPVSGTPYGDQFGPAPAQPRRRRRGFVLVTVLAVLLFLAAGAMTGLYVTEAGELDRTKKDLTSQVSERDATIAAKNTEIDKLKQDVQTAKDEVEKVKQDLSGTQNTAEELKRQKAVISKCLSLLGEASLLADQGRTTQARAKLREAEPVCTEAERYLE